MNEQQNILTNLHDVFERWQEQLAGMSEELVNAPRFETRSVKDVIGHLHAWQQVSIARLDAARKGSAPAMPEWLLGADPDEDEKVNEFNERIYFKYRDEVWAFVFAIWRDGFLRLLTLAGDLTEEELNDRTRFPWLNGYALLDVLEGSYEHHHEHLEELEGQMMR